MQILLLGATGRTGTPVLLEALSRGHSVTALVRNPASSSLDTLSPDQKASLTLVKGSPLHTDDVRRALAANHGADVVVSTLNARRSSDNPFAAPHPTDSPPRLMADSVANVVAAASAGEKPRVVVMSALGAGSSAPHTAWAMRALIHHSRMRAQYDDHDAVEAELRDARAEGRVEFVLVRPTRLVDGDEGVAKVVDVSRKGAGVPLMATVSRGAVARFLVDAAEKGEWDGEAPIIVG